MQARCFCGGRWSLLESRQAVQVCRGRRSIGSLLFGAKQEPIAPAERMPDDCCGTDAKRSLRLPTQGIELPEWADKVLAALFALGGLVPASIKVDEALQNGNARIEGLTNAETRDGVRLHVARPSGDSLGTLIVVHQFFGLRQREVDLCEELARRGFVAIAPDTFGGQTTGWVPRAISLVVPAVVSGKWGPHLAAVDSAVDYALALAPSTPSAGRACKVAICGFCFGGGLAVRYAQQEPAKVGACGVFYGKPLTEGARGLPPVYAVFGGKDSQFPPEQVDSFEALLASSAVVNEFRRYPDQAHAFVSGVEAVQEEGDARDAWEGWLAFCQSTRVS